MTAEVKKALTHVQAHHPQVTCVSFNSAGECMYTDDTSIAPIFGSEIDISILESAADSVESFPAFFHIENKQNESN